jgi:hypothetical protein
MLFQKFDMFTLQAHPHELQAEFNVLEFFFQREKLDIDVEHFRIGEVIGLLDMDLTGQRFGIVEEPLKKIRVKLGFLDAIDGREVNFCRGRE